jgi:2-dehydro-3-deoxyphosphogluconate aldolase/(4S)-4-hydroxy-2-oxoglutarate aldolase
MKKYMKKSDLLLQIEEKKIVPVVKLDRVSDAKPLGEALVEGGLPVAEITFRTDAAEESIKEMIKAFPAMLVGAGTVVNVEQAKRAVDAGVAFIVSPGINRQVIEFAINNGIAIFPGICTPSEVMIAMEYNLPVVKFFPAMQYGGLDAIKALAAPFPDLRFMPTGGISSENILSFLKFKKIIACGGSWMVKDSLIKDGDFERIKTLTKEAVSLVSNIHLA